MAQTPESDSVSTHEEPESDLRHASDDKSTQTDVRRLQRPALLVTGLLSGILSAVVIGRTAEFFPVIEPDEVKGTQGIYTPEQRALVRAAHVTADYGNAPLTFAVVGAVVAGLFGAVAAGIDRPQRPVVTAIGIGLIAGAILGGLGGASAVFLRQQLNGWNLLAESGEPDPLKTQLHTMLMHLPSWTGIAVAVGLSVGVPSGSGLQTARIAGFGFVSVVLASLVYPTLAAILLTAADPDVVIPIGTTNQMLWSLLNCGLIAVMIGHSATPPMLPRA